MLRKGDCEKFVYIDTQDVLTDTSSHSVQSVTVKTKIPSRLQA